MKALRKWMFTGLLFILLWCFIYFIPLTSALVFYDERSPVIRAYLPLQSDDVFMITFTHSIHMTEVVEKYRLLETGDIEQYERSEEHTSELQSRGHLVCRLLLVKKKS